MKRNHVTSRLPRQFGIVVALATTIRDSICAFDIHSVILSRWRRVAVWNMHSTNIHSVFVRSLYVCMCIIYVYVMRVRTYVIRFCAFLDDCIPLDSVCTLCMCGDSVRFRCTLQASLPFSWLVSWSCYNRNLGWSLVNFGCFSVAFHFYAQDNNCHSFLLLLLFCCACCRFYEKKHE